MSSNSSPAKSKGGLRSRIRHVSDTTKSLLKSTFGPGTQESLQTPTPGADPSSPVPLGGSKPRNKSDVCLSPASHTVTQQLSTSTPDLALSGQTPSTSRIAETVAEHAASNSGTTKNNPTGSNKYPDGSWKGLEMALKALHQTAKVFPPLQSAIGTMISCLELVQGVARRLHDYDEMASRLEALTTLLDKHLRGCSTATISDSIANVMQSIEKEARYLNDTRDRGTVRGIIGAAKDEDELVRCYRRIEILFSTLQINISLSAWSIANEHLANTRLESLAPAKLASFNSTLSTDINRRACTDNTRTTILSELNSWSHDPGAAKVYWMNGMAGTGKTTIACSVSKALQERKQLGASFFCTRTSPECRAAKRIVPTIAYQLARYSRAFQSALCLVIEKDPDISTRQISLQFEQLVVKPLMETQGVMPDNVVVVIDALDECEDSQGARAILETLSEYATVLPLKFLVTSRPEPVIRDRMKSLGDEALSVLHLHEIEQSLVQEDIELYLMEELAFMSPLDAQIKQLAQLSGNLFIYAATAVRYIKPSNSKNAADPQQRLRTVLGTQSKSTKQYAEIDALYTTILEATFNEEGLESDEIERARHVLWTAVCAREPVTFGTLEALADLKHGESLVVLQSLRSVLHISEASGLVSTLHASFTEYIFTQTRSRKFFCDESSHNCLLAQRCFDVMTTELRFNICALESSFILDEEIEDLEDRINKYIPRLLFYACRYWTDHLSAAVLTDKLSVMLDDFLSKRLLFWLEVLNLNKINTHGIIMLRRIQAWLQVDYASVSQDRCKLVSDAETFVTIVNANPVSLSTPHIYISALAFFHGSIPGLSSYWQRMQGLIDPKGTAIEQLRSASLASWRTGHQVGSVALSPDGSLIAFGGGTTSYRSEWYKRDGAGYIGVLNRYNGQFVVGPFQGHAEAVSTVAFFPDGIHLVSGSADKTIRVWNVHNGELVAGPFEGHTGRVTSIALSPDGTRIVSGSDDMTVCVWNAIDGKLVATPFKTHTRSVNSVVFSADSTRIASGSDDTTICLWNAHDGTLLTGPFKGHTSCVRSLAFHPDDRKLASGSDDKSICVWDSYNGNLIAGPFKGHAGGVSSVAFSDDGTHIVSGSTDSTVCVWSSQDGTIIAGPFKGHTWSISSVAFIPQSTHIVSGSIDTTICVWSTQYSNVTNLLQGHTQSVNSAAFSPNGTVIVSGSGDMNICLWNAQDGQLVAGPYTSSVNSVAFSPDGTRIASGSSDQTICVWDTEDGGLVAGPFKRHTGEVLSVAFSPDGTCIASGSEDHTICVWSTQDGKLVAGPFEGHTDLVRSVAYSPDGTRVASGSWDETICVWDVCAGRLVVGPIKGHTDQVMSVAFSPDGSRIVSSSEDKTICVWNSQDGKLVVGPIKGHTDQVMSVAFSPDGSRIVSGSEDKTICVWNSQDGKLVAGPFNGHTDWVTSVAYSPDGTRILSCSADCSIRVTNLQEIATHIPALEGEWDLMSSGWVVNRAGQRLFWVPQHLHGSLPRPHQSLAIGPQGSLQIDYSNILIGERWSECYVGD